MFVVLHHGGQMFCLSQAKFPGRSDQAHARHALDRLHQINSAGNRQPARTRVIDEMRALYPPRLREGRNIGTEVACTRFKSQQLQPILQSPKRQEMALPRESRRASSQHPPQAPEARRVEYGQHQLSIRHKDTLDFTQDLMRISRELQGMGQHHQIDALLRNRQGFRIADEIGPPATTAEPIDDAVVAQVIDFGPPNLKRVKTEHIGDERIELRLLPIDQVAPKWGIQPFGKTGI